VEGQDPHRQRIAERRASTQRDRTFKTVSAAWLRKQTKTWAPATLDKNTHHLKDLIAPLGKLPIDAITAADVLDALQKIEARGNAHSAHRTRQIASQVFQYAIASGLATNDPAAALRSALTPVKVKSHAAPTDPKLIGAILTAIDGYQGHALTQIALRLLPLVFTRSTELRLAEWNEFDLEAAEWRIPAARMKMRRPHLVPLSRQAVALLREAHALTGNDTLVFPGVRGKAKPLSENTFNAALRYLGFDQDTITAHGFRAVASTQLNELGWDPDVIERQMAHADRNKVRAVYNRNDYVLERREMMQAWADRVDALKAGEATRPMAKGKPRNHMRPQ